MVWELPPGAVGEKSDCCLTCWLSGSCLFQVVERFVVVSKVVEGHTGPVKGLEILTFFLQDFEAVLLDSLIVHQLSLEQAGYRGRGQKGKVPSTQQRQPLNVSLILPLGSVKVYTLQTPGLYRGLYAREFVIK